MSTPSASDGTGSIGGVPCAELRAFVESAEGRSDVELTRGYQGRVYLYEGHGRRLAIKIASGRGVALALRRRMLRKEHRVYRKLGGVSGVPACHGLLDGRHLVLEFVEGAPFRFAAFRDRDLFFDRLLELLRELHARGVAHGDLKKKDNLLVVDGARPCVVDFGVAVVRRGGFAPFNRYAFELARRFDFNAWAKLKHGPDLSAASAEDRALTHRTLVERAAQRIKSAWMRLRGSAGR